MKKMTSTILIITISLFSKTWIYAQQQANVVVAANLKTAMDSIKKIYELQNPEEKINVTYGASGKFYEQILSDAPFDVFFSADMSYPEKLKEKKLTVSPIQLYAIGKIAIWSKKVDSSTLQINSLLDVGIKKISIANPTTSPYGAKAVESMKYYKIYDKVKSKLVYGENITQTAQFIAFGAAEIGIIALSDILSPSLKIENGKYYIIPQSSYSPLKQGCVVLKHGKNNKVASKFYDFISSDKAIAILTYYGYDQKR